MNLGTLLDELAIDPRKALVLRHRPSENELNRVFPWVAAERPELYNAFQQTHGPRLEAAMKGLMGIGHLVSLIRRGPGQALFVGIYAIGDAVPLTLKQFWELEAHRELRGLGMVGFSEREGHIDAGLAPAQPLLEGASGPAAALAGAAQRMEGDLLHL